MKPAVKKTFDLPRVAPPSEPPEPDGPGPDDEILEEVEEKPVLADVPKGRLFACGSCGAGLSYTPGTQNLECPHCGHQQEIPQCAADVRELSFEKYFEDLNLQEEVLGEEDAVEIDCPGCGASVEFAPEIAADACPFCATHLDRRAAHAPTRVIRPNGLLPFKIDDREARTRFVQWTKKVWFAPNDLKKLAVLGRVEGLYVPYWTYDSMTFSFYTGMRGIHYWVTTRDSKGNTRRQRRTRWYPVSGRVDQFFDDILVCASKGLPEKHVNKLEPWDLREMRSYEPTYLSGFRAERYQISLKEGFGTAKIIMDSAIYESVRRHIGGDVQRISSINTQYEGITFKHVLLPVWLATYRYANKTYRVLVNARTGDVRGERPYSWVKISLAILAGMIVVGILIMLIFPHLAG
ncbi:MAG: primosomal protein N' (replication factor Y) - superfamily II helicase [Candidatus Sumerlaeia bacterium]|nr:primosomal protein N' (replication factor Y) - superfamily II helicase [Candidatus Sumerlaeia bacterium]